MKSEFHLVHQSKQQKFYLGSMPEDYIYCPVSVVINCVSQMAKNSSGAQVLQIPFQDSRHIENQPSLENLKRWVHTMHHLIDGRDVLFHDYSGTNRPALIMFLYLWTYYRIDFKDKFDLLEKIKSIKYRALDNSYFERIINEW